VPSGDLGLIETGITLEVAADQEDGPVERDDRGRARSQWDELE
jgi:hypothetical protein